MTTFIRNPSMSIKEVGKYIKHSKIQHNWSFVSNRPITITLLFSKISGKRRVNLNGKQVYYTRTFGLFTYTFIYLENTFSIVEYAPESFELYVNKEPFSRLIETHAVNYDERICEQSSENSRKCIYLEFLSNEDNNSLNCKIQDISPKRSKSDKENKFNFDKKNIRKTNSDSALTNKIEDPFK
jgi:hypothetical protein